MRGYVRGQVGWLDVDGVGLFRFAPTGAVRVVPAGSGDDATLHDTWLRSVLPLVLQARGTEVLHASAVARADGSSLALAGRMLAGKSTLAAAAASRTGSVVYADDAVPFGFAEGGVVAEPIPFRLRLREESAQLLSGQSAADAPLPARAPLAAIVVLDPRAEGEPAYSRIDQSIAVGALMPHAYCFSLDASKERLFENYARLCTAVPVWRFTYPQRIDRLWDVVDRLLALPE